MKGYVARKDRRRYAVVHEGIDPATEGAAEVAPRRDQSGGR